MSKSFNKSGSTFVLKKSPSMELPSASFHSTALVPSKYSPVDELPASAYPIHEQGEDIHHFSHPQHPLAQLSSPYIFTCAGCKEYGAGMRFSCQSCNFELHGFCALAPPALTAHSLHCQHQLVFFPKPVKSGILWSRCDICSKATKGFAFRCSTCSFQMHPCCALLSAEMKISAHPHPLKLLPTSTASASSGEPGLACGECDKKRSGRVYRCAVCDYHLHAVCAKNMVNGLHANGIRGVEKPNMVGTAVRFASHVVIQFIGGLIEGLGEGVGEVFIQSITRAGRRNSRTRTE